MFEKLRQEVTALWEGPASRLTVTGECGDQIFGSQLLEAVQHVIVNVDGSWHATSGLPPLQKLILPYFASLLDLEAIYQCVCRGLILLRFLCCTKLATGCAIPSFIGFH